MKYNVLLTLSFLIAACSGRDEAFDASGTFEAEETIISAEVSGALVAFDIEEGQHLEKRQLIGYIDSTQLHLRKVQLQSTITSVLSQRPDVNTQLAALRVQLSAAQREEDRVANLVKGGAATAKQLDDVHAQVETLKQQIAAQKSSLSITRNSIEQQVAPLQAQVAQVEDQINRCRLTSPISGTVLTKYVSTHEVVSPGKALYKIADLSSVVLRAYITGAQLPDAKLNQKVNVIIDGGPDGRRELPGVITWISDKAEFTPKTIQTRDERANLVYAIKVKVENDGVIKIGMYGEVKL